MEKGLYSINDIKNFFYKYNKGQKYYFYDSDIYNNSIEIEFTVGSIFSDKMVVQVHKFWTSFTRQISKVDDYKYIIDQKDYKNITNKSIYL